MGLGTLLANLQNIATFTTLDYDGGSVTHDLGRAGHHFSRVVAHADDTVSAQLLSVGDHELVSVRTSLLTKLCVERDLAANQLL